MRMHLMYFSWCNCHFLRKNPFMMGYKDSDHQYKYPVIFIGLQSIFYIHATKINLFCQPKLHQMIYSEVKQDFYSKV